MTKNRTIRMIEKIRMNVTTIVPRREDEKFHPLEYPAGLSPYADKGRCGANMARQVERRSKQKALKQVLLFPPGP